MTPQARCYTSALTPIGIGMLAGTTLEWRIEDPVRFLTFLAVAIAGAVFRTRLPSRAAEIPFSVPFALLSLLELSLPEALVVGCSAAALDRIWSGSGPGGFPSMLVGVAAMAFSMVGAHSIQVGRFDYPGWSVAAVATILFCFLHTFPSAAAASLSDGSSLVDSWRRLHGSLTRCFVAGSALAWGCHYLSIVAGWPSGVLAWCSTFLGMWMYSLHSARADEEKAHGERLAELRSRTIEALALAIEAKDLTTSDHLKRVQVYAVEVGREFGMDDVELKALEAAAILHDIGKLAVPEHIITKPGKLTPEEFEKMKVHPVVGAEILDHVQLPYPVGPIVRAHHEKWDGSGYPYGLRGEEIPLGARILAAVDCLDALASDRQYRRALPLEQAMATVSAQSGGSFDPDVVRVLEQRYIELERKAKSATGILLKLSIDVKISNGLAPGAGFAHTEHFDFRSRKLLTNDPGDITGRLRAGIHNLMESGISGVLPDVEEFCALTSVRLKQVIPSDALVFWLIHHNRLKPVWVHGQDHLLLSSLEIPTGHGISGWVFENGQAILNGDPSAEAHYAKNGALTTLRSAMAIPLRAAGRTIGVLTLYQGARDQFNGDQLRILLALSGDIAAALQRIGGRSEGFLHQLENELSRSRETGTPLGLIVCALRDSTDLHQLSLAVGGSPDQPLARLSESEFAIIVPDAKRATMEAALGAFANRSSEGRIQLGEAVFPDDGNSGEELLSVAGARARSSRMPA